MRIEYLFLLTLLTVPIITTVPSVVFASTGMSNCREEPDDPDCFDQPDRVGNPDDDNDDDEDVDDDDKDRDGPDDEGDENCWGQVSKGLAQKDDEQSGLGEHSSDPVQTEGDDNNETPREGVGNQNEDHPSDHADAVGGLVDDDDTEEDETPDCVD
jgi:hypothetical protein